MYKEKKHSVCTKVSTNKICTIKYVYLRLYIFIQHLAFHELLQFHCEPLGIPPLCVGKPCIKSLFESMTRKIKLLKNPQLCL